MKEKIVGHKTLVDAQGKRTHAPLYESEANAILQKIEEADKKRAALMPDEATARKMLYEAFQRLKEFGWNDACYCPKNGETVHFIEPGSSGIHQGHYEGEWPNGSYWIHSDGDLCPSHPVLYKPIKAIGLEKALPCDCCGQEWEKSFFCEKCSGVQPSNGEIELAPNAFWDGNPADEYVEQECEPRDMDICLNCCNCNLR